MAPATSAVQTGDIVLGHDGPTVTILSADPRILISAEIMDRIVRVESPIATLRDRILKIEAANRTVIYQVIGYLSECRAYVAEWPD